MSSLPSSSPAGITYADIYIRVSSDEQAAFGDSIRNQEELGRRYIDSHDDIVLNKVYIDDGVSGQKLDRDELQRMLDEDVKTGKVQLILFQRLDRWFRNLRHYLNTQAILEKHGVSWVAIEQPQFETKTAFGRMFVAQSMMIAELEAQTGAERVRSVFRSKIANGEVVSGKVPIGYMIKDKHLVLHPKTAHIPADIFSFYISSGSLNRTVRRLYDVHGIVLSIQGLKVMLKNETYIGKKRDNTAFCEPCVSQEVFDAVQRNLSKNIKSNQRYPYIFSGLLVCATCHYKMAGRHINVSSSRGYRYRYYAYECSHFKRTKKTTKACDNGGEIREVRIEEYLLTHLRDEISAYISDYQSRIVKASNQAGKQRAAIEKRIRRLLDLYLAEGISLDNYKLEKARLTAQLESLPAEEEVKEKDFSHLRAILDSDFESAYVEMTNEEKREFWRSFVSEIRISKSHGRTRDYQIIFL